MLLSLKELQIMYVVLYQGQRSNNTFSFFFYDKSHRQHRVLETPFYVVT